MKRLLKNAGLMLGMLAMPVVAATQFYVNDGIVICPPEIPPQVDATNFVNNNYFSINFTNGNLLPLPQLYTTADTLNYTNYGTMIANSGFRFDNSPSGNGTRRMAANFHNEGVIACGSASNTNTFFNFFLGLFFLNPSGLPKLQISATNVSLRSSTNIVGVDGLFSLNGKNVDLNQARIFQEGFENTPTNLLGITDSVGIQSAYWGVGTNFMFPANNFGSLPPFTPGHLVETPGGGFRFQQLVLENATFHYEAFLTGQTNVFVQGVFVNNTNSAIKYNVYFPGFRGVSVVEWLGSQTNLATGLVTSNQLYLTDDFGTFFTNRVITNFSYYTAYGTAIPINYTFTRAQPFRTATMGLPSPATSPVGVFDPVFVANEYAAYGALIEPTTVDLTNLPPNARYLTNLPGRIEINADSVLDLDGARITGLNYMSLKATNHVKSVNGAKISVPYSDISLATTNGRLSITNLLFPVVQRFTGEVDLYSARWTNDFGGFSTTYSVLLVDSHLGPAAPSQVQDLTLRSTNITISDILNVSRNLMLDTERLTITTNQLPAATYRGELNLLSSAITWPTSTPRLQYLTNNGIITSLNSIFFGGSRTSPFYSSNYNEPYMAFVNRGNVTNEGSSIWSSYFENTGLFEVRSSFGSINLDCSEGRLTNGIFSAARGDVSISANNLSVTNHGLTAGRRLSLSITNSITDTGSSNANNWAVGRGLNLYQKPPVGDLLGTTITCTPQLEAISTWAGEDRGCLREGFTNNVALGRLILDGGDAGFFTFNGTGVSNAIYVDYLELRNVATNRDGSGNFPALQIAPNMMVYFAQAVANGVSIAEKLDKQNGGRLCWVSDYAGTYSGTNVVYPDGTTNFFNAALVGSCNLDSDGDGLVNCSDTTPIRRPQDMGLTVAITGSADPVASVSWLTGPNALNTVYYKTNTSGNWLVLTNFVSGPVGGRVYVEDKVNKTGLRYYRIRQDLSQP